jgi:hypothetical protein
MISIVLDSNVLFSRELDFSKAIFKENLTNIIDEIESNDLYETIQILIPEIVIQELYHKQNERYEEQFNIIKNIKFHNFDILYDEKYEQTSNDIFSKNIEEVTHSLVKIIILPYPENNILENIIKRAILKKAPFEGKSKESDKGFKDVIIWETLLRYKREHATDSIILYSNDDRLNDISLSDEYSLIFNDTIYLISKKGTSGNNNLLKCIEDLTKTKTTPLFSELLESRLFEILNENNLSFLYVDDTIEREGKIYQCKSLEIISKDIIHKKDIIIDDRISFKIRLIVKCILLKDVPTGVIHTPEFLYETFNSELEIDYCFKNDTFYIREYDNINKGRFAFDSNEVEILNNYD